MSKKHDTDINHQINTGRKVIKYASERGAKVSQADSGMVNITTDKGRMKVKDTNQQYSSVDISNTKRWLKLLGLLCLILIPLAFWINHVMAVRAGM